MKAIRVRGIDVTDQVLAFGRNDQSLNDVEVVLTDRLNEVGGTVVDDHGRAAADARVVVFPIDRERWYPASRYLRVATAAADLPAYEGPPDPPAGHTHEWGADVTAEAGLP